MRNPIKIHREGRSILYVSIGVLIILNLGFLILSKNNLFGILLLIFSLLFILFLLRFFRVPSRSIRFSDKEVLAPADGKVVVVETVEEKKFLQKKMLQISIFMSVWDVHINWYPVSGRVVSTRHYPGKYLVARIPKSSDLNEQQITLIEKEKDEIILVKQIAGAVARRILNYSQNAEQAQAGEEMGFIRFGSRVDVLLPETYIPTVKPGQRVKGQQNVIAVLK